MPPARAGAEAPPAWTIAAPALATLVLIGSLAGAAGWYFVAVVIAIVGSVFAAVHHAEVVAHRVGEPFGTLVLALAVTLIEVALIVSLMIAGGEQATALARDTVFAAVMLILTGIVGACLLAGGLAHHEQSFSLDGASAALTALAVISVLTLVFPNFTTTAPGPFYSASQLAMIAVVSLLVYSAFVFTQAVRHRGYFLDAAGDDPHADSSPPSGRMAVASAALLLVCLVLVVALAKKLAPELEAAVTRAGAPDAVVGVLIAGIVLLPEAVAALRAAIANRLQTSLNLALGSALASIGLTIPAVSAASLATHRPLTLGIDGRGSVLMLLALFVLALALRTGRTIVLHGVALLVVFAVYVFTTIVP